MGILLWTEGKSFVNIVTVCNIFVIYDAKVQGNIDFASAKADMGDKK